MKANTKKIAPKESDPDVPRVRQLFEDMGFVFVRESYVLKGEKGDKGEIDLIFKDPELEVLLFIEVTVQQKKYSDKIFKFFTKWKNEANVKSVIRELELSKKYRVVRLFVHTVKDKPETSYDVSPEGNEYLFGRQEYGYFKRSVETIGKWAKNDFLNFLSISLPKKCIAEIPAIKYKLRDTNAYLYLDRVNRLLKYCYISRRRDGDLGYQRSLSRSRITALAKKIKKNSILAFPNSILISCSNGFRFSGSGGVEAPEGAHIKINIPDQFCACRVVDGQHRLLGFSRLSESEQEDHLMPVIALEDIDKKDEIEAFIEINSHQKKIDVNLLYLLKADFQWDVSINPKEYYERQAVEMVKRLNKGTLKEMVYIPDALTDAKRKGKITLATLASTFIRNNFVGKNCLFKETEGTTCAYTEICKVFELTRKHLPSFAQKPSHFFLSNKGLRILFRIMQCYYRNLLKENISKDCDAFIYDLKMVINKEFIEELEKFYGDGGAGRAVREIVASLKAKDSQNYSKFTEDLRLV